MSVLLFTVAVASRLLQIDPKTLRRLLSLSGVSRHYAGTGQIGLATIRLLHGRLYSSSDNPVSLKQLVVTDSSSDT